MFVDNMLTHTALWKEREKNIITKKIFLFVCCICAQLIIIATHITVHKIEI
jgi:hypothetical protein